MDFGFDDSAAVWGDTPASPPPIPSTSKASTATVIAAPPVPAPDDAFDDFDDFEAPSQVTGPDEFGDDFGDFGEGEQLGDSNAFGDAGGFYAEPAIDPFSASQQSWEPLRLDPFPSSSELEEETLQILSPLWSHIVPANIMTDEGIRQVEGLNQVLVTPESRSLYQTLFQTTPPIRPPNWTRSRIRRQHLISLGIPINLDEVLPQANGKTLPALQITTRPSSAPPGPRPVPVKPGSGSNTRTNSPRSGTPQPGHKAQGSGAGLGPKPKVDQAKVAEVLELTPDTLTLLPLATLEAHMSTLRSLTVSTSALLTHLLQQREALQQDSETYNGLIAELVGEAQRMKTGQKSRPQKRGSGF